MDIMGRDKSGWISWGEIRVDGYHGREIRVDGYHGGR